MTEAQPVNSDDARPLAIFRASPAEVETACRIVAEYYEAVGIVVREAPDEFQKTYFEHGAGVWLATCSTGDPAGCIALRRLPHLGPHAAEVKRLYVRPACRGRGVAERLLEALEQYAAAAGYRTLYLDTKDDLEAAIRFYRRQGYLDCERYNSNPQATLFMKKEIAG